MNNRSSNQQCEHRELRKWCDDDGFVRWLCVEPKCDFEIYEPPDETQPQTLEAWVNEVCPDCKGERLKGDCPTALRAKLRELTSGEMQSVETTAPRSVMSEDGRVEMRMLADGLPRETPRTYFHECQHFVGYTPESNYRCQKCSGIVETTDRPPMRTALEFIRDGQIPRGMSPALFADRVLRFVDGGLGLGLGTELTSPGTRKGFESPLPPPSPEEPSETNNLKCVSAGCTNDCEKGNPYLCAEHARSPLNGPREQK